MPAEPGGEEVSEEIRKAMKRGGGGERKWTKERIGNKRQGKEGMKKRGEESKEARGRKREDREGKVREEQWKETLPYSLTALPEITSRRFSLLYQYQLKIFFKQISFSPFLAVVLQRIGK